MIVQKSAHFHTIYDKTLDIRGIGIVVTITRRATWFPYGKSSREGMAEQKTLSTALGYA